MPIESFMRKRKNIVQSYYLPPLSSDASPKRKGSPMNLYSPMGAPDLNIDITKAPRPNNLAAYFNAQQQV